MNEATRWRMALGRRLGAAFAADPKARVVMIAGSTGRGEADRYSDLEVDVYWSAAPTDEERRAVVARAGGELLDLWPYEEDEWAEEISFGGFHVGTSTFLVETMERYLRLVVDQGDPDPLAQMRLSSVQQAQTVKGEDLVAAWRARAAAYPAALTAAMLRANLEFDGVGYAEEMFAARDDLIPLYDLVARVERQILGALLGVNRIYLANPSFKGMDALIAAMRWAPPDLAARLRAAFRLPPAAGVAALHEVIEDVFRVVEARVPDFDVAPYRARVAARRGVWDAPPALDPPLTAG
jgi:hypothetical protein